MAVRMIAEGTGCKGDEILPRSACQLFGPPDVITAYRFDSLTRRMADDDMFSSDLTDSELLEKLGHVNVPCLLAMSLDDEYVPSFVDMTSLCQRLATAMAVGPLGSTTSVMLSGGHGVRSSEGQDRFSAAVAEFLGSVDRKAMRSVHWEMDLAEDLRGRAGGPSPVLVALAGMPGFHVPLEDLKSRPDADDAVYRRGALDTFDPQGLYEKLKEVVDGYTPEEIDRRCDEVDRANAKVRLAAAG
eukprot:Skav235841  [mRNA]  locus=scaffold1931:303367:307513:- [translate_table: standard]